MSKLAVNVKSSFVSEWIHSWKSKYEKIYDFTKESDQGSFLAALAEMSEYIIHSSYKASLATVVDKNGVNTLYVNVGSKKD